VPHVHAERDVGLARVAAEMALADEQPGEDSNLVLRRHSRISVSACSCVVSP
jgi:hypothetical protein